MARDLTAGAQTAAEAEVVRPILFVYLALDGGDVRVNSSDRNWVFDGNTYLGVGVLGGISKVEETSELQANGIQLTLSGIPSAYVTTVLSEDYQGREVTIWQGFVNDSYALVADPIKQGVWLIDQMSVALGETATVTLTAENKLVRWETPNVRRYTDADQQQRFPGDLGLQCVAQTVEKEILWGRVAK